MYLNRGHIRFTRGHMYFCRYILESGGGIYFSMCFSREYISEQGYICFNKGIYISAGDTYSYTAAGKCVSRGIYISAGVCMFISGAYLFHQG